MTKIILLLTILTISACQKKTVPHTPKQIVHDTIYRDTVYIVENIPVLDYEVIDSLLTIQERLTAENDSLRTVSDTLAKRLLHSRLMLSNAKYYLDICNRNPSQDKFLRGWLNRVFD